MYEQLLGVLFIKSERSRFDDAPDEVWLTISLLELKKANESEIREKKVLSSIEEEEEDETDASSDSESDAEVTENESDVAAEVFIIRFLKAAVSLMIGDVMKTKEWVEFDPTFKGWADEDGEEERMLKSSSEINSSDVMDESRRISIEDKNGDFVDVRFVSSMRVLSEMAEETAVDKSSKIATDATDRTIDEEFSISATLIIGGDDDEEEEEKSARISFLSWVSSARVWFVVSFTSRRS